MPLVHGSAIADIFVPEFLSRWVSMRPTGEYCCCFWNIQLFMWAAGTYHLILEHQKNWHSFWLIHWDRDKMTAIFLPTFWKAFSWIKMLELRLTFHWILFLMIHLIISQYWFRYGSASGRRLVIISTNDGLIYWPIYAFLDLNTGVVTIMIKQMEELPPVTFMMTSSNGNIFCVTGHLCGEFTGPRWIPRTKASHAELWCFLWSVPE